MSAASGERVPAASGQLHGGQEEESQAVSGSPAAAGRDPARPTPSNPLLELLQRAEQEDAQIAFHPARWPVIVAATTAGNGPWKLHLRISTAFDPDLIALYQPGAIDPIGHVRLRRPLDAR